MQTFLVTLSKNNSQHAPHFITLREIVAQKVKVAMKDISKVKWKFQVNKKKKNKNRWDAVLLKGNIKSVPLL